MKYYFFVIILFLCFSCINPTCNCKEDWDVDTVYSAFDLVWYEGTCYRAVAQGRVEPGPWQEDGNDIWVVCE